MEATTSDRSDPARSVGLESARVCVLLGGRSTERDVSLSSGRQILAALRAGDGTDRRGPARVDEVEVLADGRWSVRGEPCTAATALDRLDDVDVFVLGLHGGEGENGTVQGLLSACDRAFTGSGVVGSAIGMDKLFTRDLLGLRGLTLAPAELLSRTSPAADHARALGRLATFATTGWAVKPRCGGSSVGVQLVRDAAELERAIAHAFEYEADVLVEALVDGVEVTAAVLETPDAGTQALPVIEIVPKAGRFFDYDEKYSDDGAEEFCPPRNVPEAVCAVVRSHALTAHHALRCSGYSRSDFIVPRNGGAPVFLELNTLPGMTPRSLVPLAAAAAGIDYRTLCLWIAAACTSSARSAD